MQEPSFFAEPRNWVAIAFVVFFVLFGRKLWGAIAAMLDKRAVAIQAELDEASRLRREAETMLADATKRRDAALAEAGTLLASARAEAARVAKVTAEEAQASGRRREQMALDRIAAAEKAAVDEVRNTAAEVATAAAERVIRDDLTPEADGGLIDHAIAGVSGALAPRRAA